METLPNEVIQFILKHCCVTTLQICSGVCSSWRKLSLGIINKRVEQIQNIISSQTFEELRIIARIPIYAPRDTEKLAVLKTYEQTYLKSGFEIICLDKNCQQPKNPVLDSDLSVAVPDVPSNWISRILDIRNCGCEPEDDRVCLVLALQFMPCHSLIMVTMNGTIAFFNEKDPSRSEKVKANGKEDFTDFAKPYTTSPPKLEISSDAHVSISVYHDRFVAQETTRCFIYCRILSVNHEERTVEIERRRRVFTSFWSNNLLLYKEKVFILYTTGHIGVWIANPDTISSPEERVASPEALRTMQIHSMTRLNNLILVKLSNQIGQPNRTVWTIWDGDVDGIEMVTIPMENLVSSILPGEGEISWSCRRLFRVDIWNNAFIVHCAIQTTCPQNIKEKRIFVRRFPRVPTLNDFTSVKNFQNLFYSNNSASPLQDCRWFNFVGITTAPFAVFQPKTVSNTGKNKVMNILGINYPFFDQSTLTIYNFGLQ